MDAVILLGILLNAAIVIGLWSFEVRSPVKTDKRTVIERHQESPSESSSD